MSPPTLRDYQLKAVGNIRSTYASGARRVLFVLPTGGGKTVLFADMAAKAEARGRRVVALVHRRELVRQIRSAFAAAGAVEARVGTIQAAARSALPPADFVIVDEAHHATAPTYRRVLEHYPAAHVLGVTATPARADGRGLGDVFEAMVEGPAMRWLIDHGYLARPVVYGPAERLQIQARRRGGDFVASELAAEVDRRTITGSAIDEYQKHAGGGRGVAFCVTVEHAEHVAEQFCEAGIPAASIDGSMADHERAPILAGLRSGALRVVTSCELISEGFDLPAVEAAILLRPTESLTVYLQQVGRALRTAPGKERAVILDHVGNAFFHGLPDEARTWSLDAPRATGKREAGDAPVKRCPACFAMVAAAAVECPECGHVFEVAGIAERPGELVEISADRWSGMSYADVMAAAETPADIREIARARGYKPAWVIRQIVVRFRVAPQKAAAMAGYKPSIVYAMGMR